MAARSETKVHFLKWDEVRVVTKIGSHMQQRLVAVSEFLVGEVKRVLNTPYPPASSPGQPPHKRSGMLAASIRYRLTRSDNVMSSFIGTSVIYARRLELGYVGVDAAGRNVNQKPRPYLRTTVASNKKRIIDMMKGK